MVHINPQALLAHIVASPLLAAQIKAIVQFTRLHADAGTPETAALEEVDHLATLIEDTDKAALRKLI